MLLGTAINPSTASNAISARLGNTLDAQSKVSGFTSLPLDQEQWKIEVRKMFESALARAQVTVVDIVRGRGAGLDGYENLFAILSSDYDGICTMAKVNTNGLKNILLVWLVFVLKSHYFCGC